MTKLSVNVNKVALLRNARNVGMPDVLLAARASLAAGAHGITVHPRPDERHIKYQDTRELSSLLRKEFPKAEFNIEGNPFEGKYLELVKELVPDQCTLVPDTPQQSTSDHGWNPAYDMKQLYPIVDILRKVGCRISLFMDPEPTWISLLAHVPINRVELYTESYANAYSTPQKKIILDKFIHAAETANQLGLGVNAGHDLNQENLSDFLKNVPHTLEVSIGHALIADSIFTGLEMTVKKYLKCLN